jgi:YfiH family protein
VTGVASLFSPRFGAPHAFSTRLGGVSRGPYASLNLGRSVGDDPAAVAENARRFAASLRLTPGQFACVNQVHGDRVLEAGRLEPGDAVPGPLGDADAVFTRQRGTAVAVRTADCAPVLLWAPDAGAVAAVHAGWRGAIAAIAARAVERLALVGASPAKMRAVVGPCIRRCCYEVGPDLAARFFERFGPAVVEQGARPRLDLAEACRLALLEAGVPEAAVEVLPHCTACKPAMFYSHRRDRGTTGRHLSAVLLP